MQNEHQLIL